MTRLLARMLHDSHSEYIDPIGFDMLTQMHRPPVPMHVRPHAVHVYRIQLDSRRNSPPFLSIAPERLRNTAKYYILSCAHLQSCVPSMFIGFNQIPYVSSFIPFFQCAETPSFLSQPNVVSFPSLLPTQALMLSSKITRPSKSKHEITLVLFSYEYCFATWLDSQYTFNNNPQACDHSTLHVFAPRS